MPINLLRSLPRASRAGLALPLVAGVLVSTFGAGYTVTKVAQHDGSAWLPTASTVVHVNRAGQTDAKVHATLAKDGQRLKVAQTDTGDAYATNQRTGTVHKLDTTTGAARPVATSRPSRTVEVVPGQRNAYLVDHQHNTVAALDEHAARTGPPAAGFDRIDDVVVDGGGQAWVLDGGNGRLVQVHQDGRAEPAVEVGRSDGMRLTLADDRPVVVEPGAREALLVEGGKVTRSVQLPALEGGHVEVSAPAPDLAVWIADEHSGRLWRLDLATGDTRRQQLAVRPNTDLGRPVVAAGHLYLPNYSGHNLAILDATRLAPEGDPVIVPGRSTDFDVFAHNDTVWASDPNARAGLAIGPDGRRDIDKDTGDQAGGANRPTSPPVIDPPGQPQQPPPRPPVQPAPQPPAAGPPLTTTVPSPPAGDWHQACALLARHDLACRPRSVTATAGTRAGTVIRFTPSAGSQVRRGTVVTVDYAKSAPAPTTTPPTTGGALPGPAPAPTPAPTAPPRPPPTVPSVVGMDGFSACAAVQQAGLVCGMQPVKAPARPLVIFNQSPPGGTQAAAGSTIILNYDDSPAATLWRIKRLHSNVWVIGTDQAHIDALMASGEYIDRVALGQAYLCCTREVGYLASIWSFHSTGDDPHLGDNRYYSAGPTPPGAGWVTSGEVGQVLAQPVDGAVPLWRVVKPHDGTVDFSYVTPNDLGYFQSHGFQIDGDPIGWIWS